jgi:choline dehydrogenase
MAYVRGHALDFERWSEEIGDSGWNYSHVLPYFKKAQGHELGSNLYRGGDGPLRVQQRASEFVLPINSAFVAAGQQAGYAYTDDPNGFQQEGFGSMDMTVSPNGNRSSTSENYLWPILKPKTAEDAEASKRLTVAANAQVKRILFKGSRAIGIETVSSSGDLEQHLADQEVIVSAGAVGSPKLLMLSGIGDEEHLKECGIEVMHHLPEVGGNLQDHLEFYLQVLNKQDVSLYPYAATFLGFGNLSRYLYRQPWNSVPAGISWFLQGKGMCATNHFEVGGFIRSAPGKLHPDIQYHFIAGCVVGQLDFLPEHGYQAHCGTLRPTSRGTIKLNPSDPRSKPLIDPNFLATKEDVEDQRRSFRLSMEILKQDALKPFHKEMFSPSADFDVDDDDAVDAWVREHAHSGYHLSCTCAMGRVVDAEGRVMGLEGLRVADASIMPSMTSGNLNAPTIMLAEKIADHIRGEMLAPDKDAKWYMPDDWETKHK